MGLAAARPVSGGRDAPGSARPSSAEPLRRALDVLVAFLLLLLTLPILLGAAAAVGITSGRPIFYGHRRVGRGGRSFRCWKLRTMEPEAEQRLLEEPQLRRHYVRNGYKLPLDTDPRITGSGRWLRRSYVDELPQLLNVLNGTMSMVGPRPVIEDELAEFGPHADELLSVRPGIFGAWNCIGDDRPSYPERSRIELEYVRNRSLRRDLAVLVRSVPVVLNGAAPAAPRRLRRGERLRLAAAQRPPEPSTIAAADGSALRQVLLNVLSLLGAYAVPRLLTFASVVVAARLVGVASLGIYGTAAALAVMLSVVATAGMMQLLVRELAQRPADARQLIGAANAAKGATTVLMLLALTAASIGVLDAPPAVVACALLLGVSYVVAAYAENLGAYFQAVERMQVWMQAQALFGVVTGAAGIALVFATRSVVWFCAAPVAGQLAALGWLLLRAPARLRWTWAGERREVRRLLVALLPFATAFMLIATYSKIDILFVAGWRGAAEAGIYAAAYKFVDVAQALTLVLATALYPRLARAWNPDLPRLAGGTALPPAGRSNDSTGRLLELVLLAVVPAAGLLWLLRGPAIAWLFGPEYAPSTAVLALLAPALPPLALNAVGLFLLASARRMGMVAALYGLALILNVALNAGLVPGLGAPGAAAAMLLSECALALAMVTALHRFRGTALRLGPAATALTAAGLAAAAASLPAGPVVEAAVYLTGIGLLYGRLGVVSTEERALLRRALGFGR